MPRQKNDILQGTLVLLVLRTLASQGKMHGYAIRPERFGEPKHSFVNEALDVPEPGPGPRGGHSRYGPGPLWTPQS